jgi:transcriptional regulator of acetoin/glycerol metabolism
VLADEGSIELAHLPEAIREAPAGAPSSEAPSDESTALQRKLLALLATHQGNVSAVARAMDKDRKQIQRWIKRFKIDLERDRISRKQGRGCGPSA